MPPGRVIAQPAVPVPAPPVSLWQSEISATTPSGERQLLSAIERLARAPRGWSVVALHLSRLPPPGPRPYHRRIARAMLQDAAQRGDGQMFTLRNADLVLLFCDDSPPSTPLAEQLRAVFTVGGADPAAIVSDWKLPHAGAVLLAYTVERLGDAEAKVAEEPAAPPPGLVDMAVAAIGDAQPQDFIQRQIAVLLDPPGGAFGTGMRVAYHELTFSLDLLEGHTPAPQRLQRDPALLLHLGPSLDQRMLEVLQRSHGSGSPLDPAGMAARALHLNLSLPGVLSDAFAAMAERCRTEGRALGVEISLVDATADPATFALAQKRLHQLGVRLVLDGVPHLALLLACPGALGADLLKLDWSPCMLELPAAAQAELARVVAEADPARIILHRADSEAAVRWGLAHRLRLFQGWHIDQMLAVQRMLGCSGAGACTLRQCVARAAATGGAGRMGCTNLALLDAGLPAIDATRGPA